MASPMCTNFSLFDGKKKTAQFTGRVETRGSGRMGPFTYKPDPTRLDPAREISNTS